MVGSDVCDIEIVPFLGDMLVCGGICKDVKVSSVSFGRVSYLHSGKLA